MIPDIVNIIIEYVETDIELEFYLKNMHHSIVVKSKDIPLSYIKKYSDVIDYDILVDNEKIPIEYFEKAGNRILLQACYKRKIPLRIIKENSFIRDYIWNHINNIDCKYEDLIGLYKQSTLYSRHDIKIKDIKVDGLLKREYEALCRNINVPISFLEQFNNHFSMYILYTRSDITMEFIEKYQMSQNDIEYLCMNRNITIEYVKKNIHKFNYQCMLELSFNKNIPVEYFYNYILNGNDEYGDIFENIADRISLEFAEKCVLYDIEKINILSYSYNPNLNSSFFENYINCEINWSGLCSNEFMGEDFFEKHLDKIVWKRLIENKSISATFLKKYIPKELYKDLCLKRFLQVDEIDILNSDSVSYLKYQEISKQLKYIMKYL